MKSICTGVFAFVIVGLIGGCGDKEDGGGADFSSGGSDGGSATSGSGGVNTSGSGGAVSLGGNAQGGSAGNGGSSGSGIVDPGEACAVGTATASLSNVRMLVMFDRSGSMNDEANEDTGESRWDLASTALKGFFAEPSAGGLQVALRFFPHDDPADGCNDDDCDEAACAEPLVPLGTLTEEPAPADAHEASLISATNASAPPANMMGGGPGGGGPGGGGGNQGTPIYAALGGALQWAEAQRSAAPEESAVVVLVTDGEPNGCVEDIDDIAQLAADALDESDIRTYAIGLTGSQESDIDAIAEAGGTEQGIFISDGADAEAELLEALSAIRGSVLDCDFPMPTADAGMQIDPNQINVNYTPSGGTMTTLGRVPDGTGCGANPGWYYDDPQNPARILLCPSSCTAASADPDAKLEILLGCVTEERPPG